MVSRFLSSQRRRVGAVFVLTVLIGLTVTWLLLRNETSLCSLRINERGEQREWGD